MGVKGLTLENVIGEEKGLTTGCKTFSLFSNLLLFFGGNSGATWSELAAALNAACLVTVFASDPNLT